MGKKGTWEEAGWMDWDEYEVGRWLKERGLEKYGKVFVENDIQGKNLPDCLEEKMLAALVDKPFWRQKIMAEISQLVTSSSDLETSQPKRSARKSSSTVEAGGSLSKELPPGKHTHFFGSHQKEHSVYGDTSESLGIRIKDEMEHRGFKGWFDLDDLKKIDQESINKGIRSTCCLLVLLTDETMHSEWCQKEWQCAKENNVAIIIVIDIDKFPARALIKIYIEAGFDCLFQNQCINYSSSYRKQAYATIAQAIEYCVVQTMTVPSTGTNTSRSVNGRVKQREHVHEANMDAEVIDRQLRQKIRNGFVSVQAFYDDATEGDGISRKEWKAMLHRIGLKLSDSARKSLRKRIAAERSNPPKVITLDALVKFMSRTRDSDETSLCAIPRQVPELPSLFCARKGPLQLLIDSLTASKSRNTKVISQGMGGCGKTTLTIAAVRHPSIRKHFERMAWASISQKPNLAEIQDKLYKQLTGTALSKDSAGDIDLAFQMLQTCCRSKTLLVVLDDCWNSAVSQELSFLDDSTNSRMLISTRIRGLVKGATEIQVQLLTNAEAVDMLLAMAELDTVGVAPVEVMPVIRLCGNLPLCIGVVAGMIRANKEHSSAQDCVSDVLALLQDDKAGSMQEEAEFSVSDLIVGRSVRSLPNKDSQRLFAKLGCCPEDASIPFDFVVLMWSANKKKKHSAIRMKTKKLVAMLVLHSLLQKSVAAYTMHDITRDFARECIGNVSALLAEQRIIVHSIVKNAPLEGWETSVDDKQKALKQYIVSNVGVHISEALATTCKEDLDEDAMSWLASTNSPFTSLVATQTACCFTCDELVAWAEKCSSEGRLLLAAKLFAFASFVNTAKVIAQTVRADPNTFLLHLKQACHILKTFTFNDNEKDAAATLEYNCCFKLFTVLKEGTCHKKEAWGYRDRAFELVPHLKNLTSSEMYGLGIVIQYQGQDMAGFTTAGAGLHLNPTSVSNATQFQLKGATMIAQAADQLAADDPLQVNFGTSLCFETSYFCQTCYNGKVFNLYWGKCTLLACPSNPSCTSLSGYHTSLWFSDPNEHAALCSSSRLRHTVAAYDLEIHFQFYRFKLQSTDMHLWGVTAASAVTKYGDLISAKKCLNDILSVPDEYCDDAVMTTLNTSRSGNAIMQFAGLKNEFLSAMRKYGTTPDQIHQTVAKAAIRKRHNQASWEVSYTINEEAKAICFYQEKHFIERCRKRHFLLSPSEIEKEAFIDWLPSVKLNNDLDVTGIGNWGTGDEDGAVCDALKMPEEGLYWTKAALLVNPFSPAAVICNLISLARHSVHLEQMQEAQNYFKQALKEAHRMELYMIELMLLHADNSELHLHISDAEAEANVLRALSEPPEQYAGLQ